MPNEEGLFTQEELNDLVGQARVKAREKAQADAKSTREKAKEEAEQANLAAKNEWQTLSAKFEARVGQLEPLEVQVQEYKVVIAEMLKARVKELGDNAKELLKTLPESMGALDRLSFLNQNVELFQVETRIVGTPRSGTSGKGKKTAKNTGHTRMRM